MIIELLIGGVVTVANITMNAVTNIKLKKTVETVKEIKTEVFVNEAVTAISLATQVAESIHVNRELHDVRNYMAFQEQQIDDLATRMKAYEINK